MDRRTLQPTLLKPPAVVTPASGTDKVKPTASPTGVLGSVTPESVVLNSWAPFPNTSPLGSPLLTVMVTSAVPAVGLSKPTNPRSMRSSSIGRAPGPPSQPLSPYFTVAKLVAVKGVK